MVQAAQRETIDLLRQKIDSQSAKFDLTTHSMICVVEQKNALIQRLLRPDGDVRRLLSAVVQ